jgi:hypothetical protein
MVFLTLWVCFGFNHKEAEQGSGIRLRLTEVPSCLIVALLSQPNFLLCCVIEPLLLIVFFPQREVDLLRFPEVLKPVPPTHSEPPKRPRISDAESDAEEAVGVGGKVMTPKKKRVAVTSSDSEDL